MRVFLILILSSFSIIIAKPQWKLRIPSSQFSFKDLHFSTTSHDRDKHIVYALARGYVFAINIKSFRIDSIKMHGITAIGEQHVLDAKNNRLLYGKGGMSTKYAIDLASGECSIFIPNQDDERSHFSTLYWNDKTQRLGYFGGYGYHQVRNWIYEYDNTQWVNVYENIDNCNPPKRSLAPFILGHPNKPHLFLVSGLSGNCSGNQREQYCKNGLSSSTNNLGNWCWLRDVFLYDYEKHAFTNIIGPHEESMTHEGIGAYDFDDDAMYIVGGHIPKVKERTYYSDTSYNSILRLRIGKDKRFNKVETITKGMKLYSWHEQHKYGAYYNPAHKSLVWLRNDGLWELELQ